MKRKVIQIAVATNGVLVALCDDGTMWQLLKSHALSERWETIPAIPQTPERSR